MADVFLSYAREDASRTERLAALLEAAGCSVWWDRNLTAGDRYSEETEAHLNEAKAVVVLWTRNSVTSNWVRDEAAVGRDAGKLLPLVFDGVEAPIGFRQIQALTVDNAADEIPMNSFRQLQTALARKLSPEAPAPSPSPLAARPPAAPPHAPQTRRLALIAAAVLVFAASAVFLYKAFGPPAERAASTEMTPGARLTVPPFELESSNPSFAGLASGLTHGMRAMLRDRGFDVRGYQYPEGASNARDFIDKLGVDYVVRGTIAEIGGALLYNIDIVSTRHETAVASFQLQEESKTDMTAVRKIIDRVAAAISPAAPPGGPVPENSDYYMALGLIEDAASRADFEAAQALLKRAIEREPQNASAQALYAYALASIDRYADEATRDGAAAMAAVERAFAAGGAESDALFARAVHHYIYDEGFDRLARAESDLQKSISIDPGNMRALKWLMNVQIQKGDYADAIAIADQALALSPDYRDIQGNKISAQLSLGERETARRTLDDLLGKTPKWAWGRRFRASVALSDGDLVRARQEVERAEALDAVSWNAELLTIIEVNSGALADACAAIDLQAQRSGLDPAWISYKKSIIVGDLNAARTSLEELVNRENRPRQRAQALVALGFVHLYGDAPSPALKACAASVELLSADANLTGPPELAEVCAAIAAARLGKMSDAKSAIQRFSATRPGKHLYRPYWTEALLAALQAETGDKNAAMDTIESMIAQGWRMPNTALCRHCIHLSVADSRGLYAKIAGEPRFQALLASIGAPLHGAGE